MTATATTVVVHELEAVVPGRGGAVGHCRCGHVSGRYVNPRAARVAIENHVRWASPQVSSTTPAAARAAKVEGQDLSLFDVTQSDVDVTRAAVLAIAPGELFSANDLRDAWDRAGVDEGRRAGLLRDRAVEGLAEPWTFAYRGEQHPHRVASTGKTAKGAGVVIYLRTERTEVS